MVLHERNDVTVTIPDSAVFFAFASGRVVAASLPRRVKLVKPDDLIRVYVTATTDVYPAVVVRLQGGIVYIRRTED